MITRENIIEKLEKKYPEYRFIPTEVTKNGDVRLQAIIVRDESPISPTIYTDSIIKHSNSIYEAVETISNLIEQHMSPDIDISKITDKMFILDRIRIGVQKSSDEPLVKRDVPDFPGMEAYLYFIEKPGEGDNWSVKIRPDLLSHAGISEELAWELAEKHTFQAATIKSMAEVMAEMMGFECDDDFNAMAEIEMYIISNREKCKGAASIINHAMLEQFAKEHDCKAIACLPSSINECLLIPMRDSYSISEFDEMVKEVNRTQVAPEEVLVDRAYLITFE